MGAMRHAASRWLAALWACMLLLPCAQATPASRHADIHALREVLRTPEEQIDFGKAKVAIDRLVDPSIDAEATLARIDAMARDVRAMVPFASTVGQRADALQAYLYLPGPWNKGVTFGYDFSDPAGTHIPNKLLANYLRTRKGNCVSMPFLYIALAQRLGLTVGAAVVPSHVFVKLRDNGGTWHNIEATSNAGVVPDSSYERHTPMTAQAIANGIYMRPLGKRETLGVMAHVLAEHYSSKGQAELTLAVSDLILDGNPRNVDAMLHKGYAYYLLMRRRFMDRFPQARDIPANLREEFLRLQANNLMWYRKAEQLGWREPSKEEEASYLARVREAAKAQR